VAGISDGLVSLIVPLIEAIPVRALKIKWTFPDISVGHHGFLIGPHIQAGIITGHFSNSLSHIYLGTA
jgi:hypothetical protein